MLKGLMAPLPVLFAVTALLLLPAGLACGAWVWPRAWGFLAVLSAASIGSSVALALARPASFKVRQQGLIAAKDKRQPLIDAVGSVFYAFYLASWLAFIPVDIFRLRLLAPPPAALSAVGGAIAILGVFVAHLAIAQNRFAAPTIHDQAGQQVIDTGLYALVRHPFYAGMLLVYGGLALWLGSYAALIAASAFLVMTLARTLIEEAYLRRTLPSYAAYTRRVRGRLIPYLL